MLFDNRPMRTDGWQLVNADKGLALSNPRSGRTIQCNETLAAVWALCDGTRPLSAIVEEITEAYELADSVASEVEQAVDLLVRYRVCRFSP